MFKSYYVVWKHKDSMQARRFDRRFKSYYVVWKHDVQASTVKKLKRFKSYYVVWKLNSFVTYFIMYEV